MKQFFQTDPDTRQFCRALSPTTYQFTDIVPFHSKSASPNRNYYAVAAETIDLSAYTIRQLEQAVERVTTTAAGSWCSFADVNYDFPVCSLVLPVFESSLTFDDLMKGAS